MLFRRVFCRFGGWFCPCYSAGVLKVRRVFSAHGLVSAFSRFFFCPPPPPGPPCSLSIWPAVGVDPGFPVVTHQAVAVHLWDAVRAGDLPQDAADERLRAEVPAAVREDLQEERGSDHTDRQVGQDLGQRLVPHEPVVLAVLRKDLVAEGVVLRAPPAPDPEADAGRPARCRRGVDALGLARELVGGDEVLDDALRGRGWRALSKNTGKAKNFLKARKRA